MPAWGSFGYFDTATLAPNGNLVALVDSDGTKALLLEPGGWAIRELNRSWYCATSYRYPLALFTLPDGRTGVAHCPEHYNRIEIEVAATGERLTADPARRPADMFHSRLQVSDDCARLLSAGWLWHPVERCVRLRSEQRSRRPFDPRLRQTERHRRPAHPAG